MNTLGYESGRAGGPGRASAPRGPHVAVLGGMGLAALLLALAVAAQADCIIEGPAGADVSQRFVLCGPAGSDFSYPWSGPGAPARGRGSFGPLNRYLVGLNNGRGVGPVCE